MIVFVHTSACYISAPDGGNVHLLCLTAFHVRKEHMGHVIRGLEL